MAASKSGKSAKKRSSKAARKPAKKTIQKSSAAGKAKRKKKKGGSKKAILFTVVIALICLVIGVVYLLTNLNFIVKYAIEKYGSQATQTAVRVKGVDIHLKDAAGSIEGLTVANPKGYNAKHAFSLGKIRVDLDLKSLTGDEIRIEDILIRAPHIFAEVNRDQKSNLMEIKGNLPSGRGSGSKSSKKEGKEARLYIRRIRFSEGKIDAAVVSLNREYELKMPAFEMTNLRGTPSQIASQIISRVCNLALYEVKKMGVGKQLQSGFEKQKKEAADKVKDWLKK